MTDLTTTDDWLTQAVAEHVDWIRTTATTRKLYIHDHWQPRSCPPHPVNCPAGGEHVWMSDGDERGAYIACEECGADAEGQFYPEEEVNGHVSR